jgi:hypothetical protein
MPPDVERRLQLRAQRVHVVARHAVVHRLRAGERGLRREHVRVRRHDAPRGAHLVERVDVHQLVAGADDRDARAAEHAGRAQPTLASTPSCAGPTGVPRSSTMLFARTSSPRGRTLRDARV